jgi:hypothetical protein
MSTWQEEKTSMFTRDFPTTWLGTYSYNPTPGTPEHSIVSFTIQIKFGWLGRFKGWIDEDELGIPERATISGTIRGRRIHFKKWYKSSWSTDCTGKLVALTSVKPHVIHYEGSFESEYSAIKGSWKIKARRNLTIDGVTYDFAESTGTWKANLK